MSSRTGGASTGEGVHAAGARRSVLACFVLAITCAGGMFVFKLFSFMKTIKKDELAGFAFDPILIYAVVTVGFLCLLAWAFLTGQFRDIERPKYEMLERCDAQDRSERTGHLGGPLAESEVTSA